jgi:hypothetical protein
MNALKPRPSFQVLIMSEESRLGLEQMEVSYALKQIVQGGERVFCYLEDRERTLDSPTDQVMLALTCARVCVFAQALRFTLGTGCTFRTLAFRRKDHSVRPDAERCVRLVGHSLIQQP